MKLIIPMAGQGKRMRPHTLTTPKPLTIIAGKPVIERLILSIIKACQQKITMIGFIINDLSEEHEATLKAVVGSIGAETRFYKQSDPLGTAHAIFCAQELLDGQVIVAFSDTLFATDCILDTRQESVIFVKKVEDPSEFGVVELGNGCRVQNFIEKPKEFVTDFAMIGIYYFRHGTTLKQALQQLLQTSVKGEYFLTSALERMRRDDVHFVAHEVTTWLDCGTKDATVYANKVILTQLQGSKDLIADSALIYNSIIIPPVYIGSNVVLHNTVLGPYVSVGNHTFIYNSRIKNSLIQAYSHVNNANLDATMLGNHVNFSGISTAASIGDYNTFGYVED